MVGGQVKFKPANIETGRKNSSSIEMHELPEGRNFQVGEEIKQSPHTPLFKPVQYNAFQPGGSTDKSTHNQQAVQQKNRNVQNNHSSSRTGTGNSNRQKQIN
jgi:hypothetical protein